MDTGLVGTRYAKALLRFAQKQAEATAVYEEMQQFLAVYYADRRMAQLLNNPAIRPAQQKDLLTTALALPEQKLSKSSTAFIDLLLQNNRVDRLALIAHDYCENYRSAFGIVEAKVSSVVPLNAQQSQDIVRFVQAHTQAKEVRLYNEINKSLKAGFVLDFNNCRLNLSLQRQLEQLRQSLLQ